MSDERTHVDSLVLLVACQRSKRGCCRDACADFMPRGIWLSSAGSVAALLLQWIHCSVALRLCLFACWLFYIVPSINSAQSSALFALASDR